MLLGTSGVIWGDLRTFWGDFSEVRMQNHSVSFICDVLFDSNSTGVSCSQFWHQRDLICQSRILFVAMIDAMMRNEQKSMNNFLCHLVGEQVWEKLPL